MAAYVVDISGCDDSTCFRIDLTELPCGRPGDGAARDGGGGLVSGQEALQETLTEALEALAELLAWRAVDRVSGTATDEATARLRDVADRLGLAR